MQSSPAQPTAPAAPPAPGQPTAVVQLPEGPLPLGGVPRDANEIQGLRARREILRDQLSRATNRRSDLAHQLNRGLPEGARAGIQQRLDLLDQRILQLERDQALTERMLTSASPEVLAMAGHSEAMQGPMWDDDEAAGLAFGAFGFGILLTLVLGRVRRRFARRRGTSTDATARVAALDNPHLERLSLAVDAIAEEVERIGEGQRFVTQLLANRRETPELTPEVERR